MENLLFCTPDTFCDNEVSFVDILKDHKIWREIPLINYTPLHELKDLSLVRFRGMIQDMLDPEIYLEKYELKSEETQTTRLQNGKYRDCIEKNCDEKVNYNGKNNISGERHTMFVVSIPGLNEWAIDYEKTSNSNSNSKTKLESIDNQSQGKKRTINNDEEMDIDSQPGLGYNTQSSTTKRIKNDDDNQTATANNITNKILSSEYLLNSPINDRPGKACMIKIYNNFDNYILNTVIDVIGFLSVDPILDGSTAEKQSEFDDINEIQANNPPPSLIPRLHAICVRKLVHLNPLLDNHISMINEENINMELVYKDLKIVLTQCLFGDVLAAEYLLVHLISTVYGRTDYQSLGQFSVNLCNIPTKDKVNNYTGKLYEIIESILPASHYLPMTLENMNEKQFVPKKDYETNKLTSGLLQLAPHTHLILDETQLQTGKLETNGVLAIKNIANIIKNQQVSYDFKFYMIKYNTDIPVLVLSEGRSMLPNNVQVPLNIDPECFKIIDETFKAAKHYLQSKLTTFRIYLTQAKLYEFTMHTCDTEMIEKDFVEMRKTNSKIDADSLHSLLVLSRLLGIANGKNILDKVSWEMAKQLENERRERLERMAK